MLAEPLVNHRVHLLGSRQLAGAPAEARCVRASAGSGTVRVS